MGSLRVKEPTLSCPAFVATAKWLIKASSVSPERSLAAGSTHLLSQANRVQRLADREDMIEFNQYRGGHILSNAFTDTIEIRSQEIIADYLYLVPDRLLELLLASLIRIRRGVLDGDSGILLAPRDHEFRKPIGRKLPLF